MKTVVCVKQVAALGDEVEIDDSGRDVDHDYLESSLNEWDVFALEEALRLKESLDDQDGHEVVVVTVGDEECEQALRRCLAMGADRAIRVEAGGIDESDPLTTARRLAGIVGREGPDLVLCGVQSSDAVQAATGVMLAELAGLPRVAVVTSVHYDATSARAQVHRELEGGLLDEVEVGTPALLTIQTGINEPRYATLRAIKQANAKEIEVVSDPSDGPRAYTVRKMFVPEKGEGAELLGSAAPAVAARIAEIVKARLS